MSVTTDCPLCGGLAEETFAVGDRNRGITTEIFSYRRCMSCSTLFLADVPADLGRYYPPDYYGVPSAEQLDRAARGERLKLAFLRPWVVDGQLVEIGSAFGLFAHVAKQAGFDVTAIEMDDRCCTYLQNVVGVRAIQSDAPERALERVEQSRAIVLWHSLEHLQHPWEVLEQAAKCLEPGGVLVIAMPNPESVQFRLLGSRWAHIDAPRHLFLIPFSTLARRAKELGLDVGSVTTSDPAGRFWNWFGWEYALRRHPGSRPPTVLTRVCAHLLGLGASPVERRGMNGTTYTAVFVKSG
jgi:SAM-dependent methyltransferase